MESVSTGAGRASPSPQEALKDAIVVDTQQVRSHLDEVVRSTLEQTLNQLLDEEADRVAGADRTERVPRASQGAGRRRQGAEVHELLRLASGADAGCGPAREVRCAIRLP